MNKSIENSIIISIVVIGSLFVSFNLAHALFVDYNETDGFKLDKGIKLNNTSEITLNQKTGGVGMLEINNTASNGSIQLRFGSAGDAGKSFNVKNSTGANVFKIEENGKIIINNPNPNKVSEAQLSVDANGYLNFATGISTDHNEYKKGIILRKGAGNSEYLLMGNQVTGGENCGFIGYNQTVKGLTICPNNVYIDGRLKTTGHVTSFGSLAKIEKDGGKLKFTYNSAGMTLKANTLTLNSLPSNIEEYNLVTQKWVTDTYYKKRSLGASVPFGEEMPLAKIPIGKICEVARSLTPTDAILTTDNSKCAANTGLITTVKTYTPHKPY